MKKSVLIILLLFISNTTSIYAQYSNTIQINAAPGNMETMNRFYQLDEFIKRLDNGIDYSDVDSYNGTPYATPVFLLGNIYEKSTLLANNIALRYNAISDEIEVKESMTTSDDEAKPLTKSIDIYVKINEDIFIFAPYQGGIENGGYFLVLFEGEKYNFYKKLVKKFTPAKKATTSITTDTPAIFKDRPVYYIVTKDGKYYEFPSSKNKKLKVFGEKKEEVKKYVKENNLDLNNEKDLKKAIVYFDNLESSKL
ncbi:MAG: hypothetical protein L3J09_04250 [Flavobacteriaceae bacterium]|nr:hypothetical protein [Flavobacteriaceae bacterium]